MRRHHAARPVPRRLARAVALASMVLVALVASAAPAAAHAGNGDSTIGHVCIDADGGYHLAAEEADGTCPSGQTAAHLASTPITGPQMTIAGSTTTGGSTTGTGVGGPAGAIGPRGPAGPTGPTGPTGASGPAGIDGLDGLNGLDGEAGAQGPQGPAGPAGSQGATGTAGPVGPQGPAGADGDEGALGPAGPQGPQGPAGVAGLAGATGPQGIQGIQGLQGPSGPSGSGATGATGPQGPTGNAGTSILNGTGAPANGTGNNGDYYIRTDTSEIYGPKAAGSWPGSGVSLIGDAGSQFLSGAGVPGGGTGVDGDFYFDTSARAIYGPKSGGVWGSGTALTGLQGAAGTAGATILSGTGAPAGGVDGDFYFRTSTGELFGPKASGSWPLSGTSLVGAAGSQFHSGAGAPGGGTGVNGDFYFDTTGKTLYGPKSGGVWGSGVALNGTNGTNGTNGAAGSQFISGAVAPTTEGVDGDFYFDTATTTLYGPKAGGVWPSGTVLGGGGSGVSRVWVPIGDWQNTNGSPNVTFYGSSSANRGQALYFDQAAEETAAKIVDAATDLGWTTYDIDLWWTVTANSGDVVWRVDRTNLGDGTTLNSETTGTLRTSTAPAANVHEVVSMDTGIAAPTAGQLLRIEVVRVAANGSDTLAGDAGLIGIMLRKAS